MKYSKQNPTLNEVKNLHPDYQLRRSCEAFFKKYPDLNIYTIDSFQQLIDSQGNLVHDQAIITEFYKTLYGPYYRRIMTALTDSYPNQTEPESIPEEPESDSH